MSLGMFIAIAVLFGGMMYIFYQQQVEHDSTLARARQAYDDALASVKQNPQMAERREYALACGRKYAELCREGGRVAIFDEVALMNDLNAATAGMSEETAGVG